MTPKQRVLKHYPGAVAYLNNSGRYEITHLRQLGSGQKEKDAWEDAARKINSPSTYNPKGKP